MHSVRKQHLPEAKQWVFQMHPASWHEWTFCEAQAREKDNSVSRLRFVPSILVACIDGWSLERDVTAEHLIGELPPNVVDELYAVLEERTRPSVEQLAPLMTAVEGNAG